MNTIKVSHNHNFHSVSIPFRKIHPTEKKGYNDCHDVEDMIAVIRIAFNFRYPFLQYNSYFWQHLFVKH